MNAAPRIGFGDPQQRGKGRRQCWLSQFGDRHLGQRGDEPVTHHRLAPHERLPLKQRPCPLFGGQPAQRLGQQLIELRAHRGDAPCHPF